VEKAKVDGVVSNRKALMKGLRDREKALRGLHKNNLQKQSLFLFWWCLTNLSDV